MSTTVSFLLLTLDRFEVTKKTWEHNTKAAKMNMKAGTQWCFEYLVADNGSEDKRIVDYFEAKQVDYHRINKTNEGVGRALNQLYLRATGNIICLLGNDIEMPYGWLATAIDYLNKVEKPGIAGFAWAPPHVPPITERNGVKAHFLNPTLNRVFGTWVVKRELVEDLGLFYEGYGPYGIEDSDFNERVNRSGYNSFYIPGMSSKHLVNDAGLNTPYRKMKDESLSKNLTIFTERVQGFENGYSLKCEPPQMLPPTE